MIATININFKTFVCPNLTHSNNEVEDQTLDGSRQLIQGENAVCYGEKDGLNSQ